jgi:hypothetical protein
LEAAERRWANAVFNAVQKLKEKATQLAAHLLGRDASAVSFKRPF